MTRDQVQATSPAEKTSIQNHNRRQYIWMLMIDHKISNNSTTPWRTRSPNSKKWRMTKYCLIIRASINRRIWLHLLSTTTTKCKLSWTRDQVLRLGNLVIQCPKAIKAKGTHSPQTEVNLASTFQLIKNTQPSTTNLRNWQRRRRWRWFNSLLS